MNMPLPDNTYGKFAGYYEAVLGRRLLPLRRNIRTFIHYKGHKRIADLCCGTGRQLQMIAAPGLRLWGLDLSRAMLDQTERTRGIVYIRGDAAAAPFRDESFDAVILSFALHEKSVEQRRTILRRSWECLRPQGHLILADYCRVPAGLKGRITAKAILPIIERLAGREHFANYSSWMQMGALESVINDFSTRTNIISLHFSGTVAVCSLEKKAYDDDVFLSLNKPIG